MSGAGAGGEARLRVLSFTTLFPNPVEPGRGIFVRNRLAEIASRADLLVIAPVNAGRNPRVLSVPFRRRDPAGFDVLHPRFAVLPGMLKQWDAAFLFGETWPQVRAAIPVGAAAPDLVDAHYAFPDGAAGARLARELGVPFVLSVRGSDLEVIARDGARREPIRRALQDAGAVIAVSRSLERRALELGATAERTHVVPNGVDVAQFLPLDRTAARDALGIRREERMVLAVARLEPVKGLDLLSAAMAALRARSGNGEARAHVVGEGPGRRAVEEAIRASGAGDVMRLHGSRPADTLPLWYAASDVVCLLSHSEGCPNVVLEALACGRPVVATDVGGIPDLVRDGENGFLVRSRNPEEVADRLAAALTKRWDTAAIAAAARRSWGLVAEEQMGIYRKVVGCPLAPTKTA
jgi:teichuronic acid biosynthesis glycosyltransferase TuaC